MAIDRDAVQRVIDLLAASQAAEIEIEDGDTTVRVVRRAGAAVPPAQPQEAVAAKAAEEQGPGPVEVSDIPRETAPTVEYVTAGLVGLFHRGRAPDDQPIVSVGDEVVAGQVIGTIEALRKLTDVVTPCDGTVQEVLAEDGESVQFGDRLFAILPEE